MATLLQTAIEQPDTDALKPQMRHVLNALEAKIPKATAHLDTAQCDDLAFTAESWRQIWWNNPQERLNQELWRPHRRGRHLPRPHRPDLPGRRSAGGQVAFGLRSWLASMAYTMGIEVCHGG